MRRKMRLKCIVEEWGIMREGWESDEKVMRKEWHRESLEMFVGYIGVWIEMEGERNEEGKIEINGTNWKEKWNNCCRLFKT